MGFFGLSSGNLKLECWMLNIVLIYFYIFWLRVPRSAYTDSSLCLLLLHFSWNFYNWPNPMSNFPFSAFSVWNSAHWLFARKFSNFAPAILACWVSLTFCSQSVRWISDWKCGKQNEISPSTFRNRRNSFFSEIFMTKVQFPWKISNQACFLVLQSNNQAISFNFRQFLML